MLDWLKSAWARWKVQVSMVGGVIVVATAYGTCSYDPQQVSEAEVSSETTGEVVPVSSTTTTTATETTTTETSETTTETTATE